jgi:hypothetical protein
VRTAEIDKHRKEASDMKKILLVGVLAVFVLSACNTSATSMPDAIITPVSLSTKTPILPTSTLAAPPTSAPITEQPDSFEYPSVAEALADLKTRGDVSIEVSQGWTIVTEADGLTTWSFTPSDHPAYPAVSKRILYEDQDGWHIKMNVRCEAEKAACDQFVRDFEALNEQMLQYIEQQKKP